MNTVSVLTTSVRVNDADTENDEQAHFVFDVDNGRTLVFVGTDDVKYTNAVSGCGGFAMVVSISGGLDSRMSPPVLDFKNKDRNYSIRKVPNDVESVANLIGPKTLDVFQGDVRMAFQHTFSACSVKCLNEKLTAVVVLQNNHRCQFFV